MVVVGLMIAKHGRPLAMSDTTRRYVDLFWALLDEILNAVLFVLIGMEVLVISFSASIFLAAGCDHRDTSGPPADGGRSRRAC
jgi:CPA1 family monovalent cation:H+ antiporter